MESVFLVHPTKRPRVAIRPEQVEALQKLGYRLEINPEPPEQEDEVE